MKLKMMTERMNVPMVGHMDTFHWLSILKFLNIIYELILQLKLPSARPGGGYPLPPQVFRG